jgi:hypothetical protein
MMRGAKRWCLGARFRVCKVPLVAVAKESALVACAKEEEEEEGGGGGEGFNCVSRDWVPQVKERA